MMDYNADLTWIHPARTLPFDELAAALDRECKAGTVRATHKDGATLYCYTKDCVYNRLWNKITMLARGLILDYDERRIAATPLPKFFNLGERIDSIPDLPFEIFEKLDGSLITIYFHRGRWRAATKGSLDSEQARWAQAKLDQLLPTGKLLNLAQTCTFQCEAVYADNRIVVHYPTDNLVLLAIYREDGREIAHRNLELIAKDMGWGCARRFQYASVSDLMAHTKTLPATEEGFVLRFSDGLRLKLKGDEYCRVHRLISGCTPLALWEAMLNGDDLRAIRRDLPEEFWTDFDKITGILTLRIATFVHQVETAVASVAHLDDRELGKTLKHRIRGPWADFVFHCRKKGTLLPSCDASKSNPVPSIRRAVFMQVRPTGNRLDGYTPSAAVNRVVTEDSA